MPTELDDLHTPLDLPPGTLALDRDARLFATRRALVDRLRPQCVRLRLIPDELLHPEPPCDLVVRRGNLRVSELLADGREVTRAVLQTGAVCRVREESDEESEESVGERPGSALYSLGRTVLLALSDTEIWRLPAGAVDTD
jgi:hypothetical protein